MHNNKGGWQHKGVHTCSNIREGCLMEECIRVRVCVCESVLADV